MSGNVNNFPGLNWGFDNTTWTPPAAPQPQAAPPPPPTPTDVLEIDFRDGINNGLELALMPQLDFVGIEAVGAHLQPGATAHYQTTITRSDRPGWQQGFTGSTSLGMDGMSAQTQVQFTADGQPQPVAWIQDQSQMGGFQGNRTFGRVEPGRVQGQNEAITISTGWNGGTSIQANIDGQPVQESSAEAQMGWRSMVGMGGAKVEHQGNFGGVPLQRTVEARQDGTCSIDGRIGNLRETGTVYHDNMGQVVITRDIGPYHVEQRYRVDPGQGGMWGGQQGWNLFG